jgi:hypothetical protein
MRIRAGRPLLREEGNAPLRRILLMRSLSELEAAVVWPGCSLTPDARLSIMPLVLNSKFYRVEVFGPSGRLRWRRSVRMRRWSGDNCARRHISGHNCARSDDRVVPNGDAFQNDGAASDPDTVANPDGKRSGFLVTNAMLIGIHDHDIPCDLAVSTDVCLRARDDLGVSIQIGAVANEDAPARKAFKAHTREETTVLYDYLTATIDHLDMSPSDEQARASEFMTQPCATQVR